MLRRARLPGDDQAYPFSDAREQPYADGTFNAIYVLTTLGGIPQPDRVLREAARMLAPAGGW
ncbi:methyltransferase domain-containing protein [Streptomyces sp. NRRL B-3229]|uniref:methyltransferase domain-containing protein n=1 Tax=Streptomyces sp. NRRL B-3229 TaxID=1463836 RepID=UPI001F393D8F|nr:methyltransferase domain-containing protein [Streptomyces sp. NRRL B-3229]